MRKIIIITLVILSICISIFLLFFNPKKAIKLILPDLNKIALIDAKVKGDSVFTKIDLAVQNTSLYNLYFDSLYYEVKLSGVLVAEDLIALDLNQGKFEIDTVTIPINIPFKEVRSKIKSLQGSDSTDVSLNFHIIYNTMFGRMQFDYDKIQRIAVPTPPVIKVLKSSKVKYNIFKKILTANVVIEILNEGKNLDMELNNLTYHFKSRVFEHKTQTVKKKIKIKPSAKNIVELPITIKINHPFKALVNLVTAHPKIDYELTIDADMKLGNEDISDEHIPIHFEAEGLIDLKSNN